MKSKVDPSLHRLREQVVIEHVRRLLDGGRIGFPIGRKPARPGTVTVEVSESNDEADLKRLMIEMDMCDRDLQARMPLRRRLAARATRRWLLFFRRPAGALYVTCFSPWRHLLDGGEAPPMGAGDLATELSRGAREAGPDAVMVVASTTGFTEEARQMATGRGRTIVLLCPAETGGWSVQSPPEAEQLAKLLDPEPEAEKRRRIDECIRRYNADAISGGLAASRIARETGLPVELVQDEMQACAERLRLRMVRCDGDVMLVSASSGDGGAQDGGQSMLNIFRRMLGRPEDIGTQINRFTEKRAALAARRDRLYDEMESLEKRELQLREQFKSSSNELSKRRLTSQILQLRKDLERRQQNLSMLSQQIEVLSTHVHNLELIQLGRTAELPGADDLARQQAAAEKVMAELQADAEAAGALGTTAATGMTNEERALYEQLEAEARKEKEAAAVTESRQAPEAPTEDRGKQHKEDQKQAVGQDEDIALTAVPDEEELPRGDDGRKESQGDAG